jgi:hypothetical protein
MEAVEGKGEEMNAEKLGVLPEGSRGVRSPLEGMIIVDDAPEHE